MQFTFGFEIEGFFHKRLRDSVTRGGDWKDDGSVDDIDTPFDPMRFDDMRQCERCEGSGYIDSDCDCEERDSNGHYPCFEDDEYHREECFDCGGSGEIESEDSSFVREFASDVFNSPEAMLQELALFDSEHYRWNYSCGLHVHIGVRNRSDRFKLQRAACDFELLQRLHSQAEQKYCSHQAERTLHHTHYCRFWQERKDLMLSYDMACRQHDTEKYLFCNFHPQGTLEFRFLVPCHHKVKNVEKLFKVVLPALSGRTVFERVVAEPSRQSKLKKVETVEARKLLRYTARIARERDNTVIITNGRSTRQYAGRQLLAEYRNEFASGAGA